MHSEELDVVYIRSRSLMRRGFLQVLWKALPTGTIGPPSAGATMVCSWLELAVVTTSRYQSKGARRSKFSATIWIAGGRTCKLRAQLCMVTMVVKTEQLLQGLANVAGTWGLPWRKEFNKHKSQAARLLHTLAERDAQEGS